jgi:hypothetical protein
LIQRVQTTKLRKKLRVNNILKQNALGVGTSVFYEPPEKEDTWLKSQLDHKKKDLDYFRGLMDERQLYDNLERIHLDETDQKTNNQDDKFRNHAQKANLMKSLFKGNFLPKTTNFSGGHSTTVWDGELR